LSSASHGPADHRRLTSSVAAYALFLRIGLHSGYAVRLLPTVCSAASDCPRLRAAEHGRHERHRAVEQGLAGGLVSSSFQFGGALTLALVQRGHHVLPEPTARRERLDGFHAAIGIRSPSPSPASPRQPCASESAARPSA
jgi:hypothetical protein